MAKFELQLPNELLKEFENLEVTTPKMLQEMVDAGAKKVYDNVKNNMSKSFKKTDRLNKCLHVSNTYKTPSDDGTNTKVFFSGYLDDKEKHSAPLVAMAREYGTSRGEKKKPFFKKSFKKSEIEAVMKNVQEKYLPKS